MFDLTLLPFRIEAGTEANDLPGLAVIPAPRRCQRSRSHDLLLILLTVPGGVQEEALHTLFAQAAKVYFRERGSATAGLRAAAGELNLALLEGSLQAGQPGARGGLLNMAVLRRGMLYLAHAGPAHTLIVHKDGMEHFQDAACRPLGISRTPSFTYYQALLQEGDLALFSPDLPDAWAGDGLTGASGLTFDQLRRRVLGQGGPDLQAAFIKFQPGHGRVRALRPREGSSTPSAPRMVPVAAAPSSLERMEPMAVPAVPAAAAEGNLAEEFPVTDEALPESSVETPAGEPSAAEAPAPATDAGASPAPVRPSLHHKPPEGAPAHSAGSPTPSRPPGAPGGPARKRGEPQKTAPKPSGVKRTLAKLYIGARDTRQRVRSRWQAFLGKFFPEGMLPFQPLPQSTMLFIAIAVPLVLAAVGTTVYYRTGRSSQHRAYLETAQAEQQAASASADPNAQRTHLSAARAALDQAEEFGVSDESQALRQEVQTALDSLEGVTRLGLQPDMVGELPEGVKISRLTNSITGDLYALDSVTGRVLRLLVSSQGYQLDPTFQCGPGPVADRLVGPLVDMVAIPLDNDFGASLLAIDVDGNLLYCSPDEGPTVATLGVPANGWDRISAMTIDQGVLYVLDPPNNAVWFYTGSRQKYNSDPRLFFDSPPEGMATVTDMEVNGEDLYLLRQDSMVIWCTFREFNVLQTKCQVPAPYRDARPGRDSTEVSFPGIQFSQLKTTAAPDSSLYLLDAAADSLYHFSLQLNLQHILAPTEGGDYPLPAEPMSAFTIVPGRKLVAAFGDQVYSAVIP